MQELENELSEFKASKKLMKEIDEAYSKDFLENVLVGLRIRNNSLKKVPTL